MLSGVYLISSLPSLSFAQAPPITMEEFMDEARSQLSRRQFKKLEKAGIRLEEEEEKGSSRSRGITAMLKALQEDIIHIREARSQKKQPRPEVLPKQALTGNPQQREEAIMRWQWEELTEMERGKEFTLKDVIIYKLRLELLLRMASFTKERGSKVLEKVVSPRAMEMLDEEAMDEESKEEA